MLGAIGYVIGSQFARSVRDGLLSLLGAAAVGVALWNWRQCWLAPLRGGRLAVPAPAGRATMAGVLAVAALTAGVRLGLPGHRPACPVPTALRVWTSPEILSAIQAAIPGFYQHESSCFAVQLEAYTANEPQDLDQLRDDLDSWWGSDALNGVGPEPDIFIPDSSAEVAAIGARRGMLRQLGQVGYSPWVVAVPTRLAQSGALAALSSPLSWTDLYDDLKAESIRLAVPNAEYSETGLLGIAGLYPDISRSDQRSIEAPGNLPPDSETLLCNAGQAASQPQGAVATAYLVSEVAMANYDAGNLSQGGCAASGAAQQLTAFYPAGAGMLNFPFIEVNLGRNQDRQRQRYEQDFYRWLTSGEGAAILKNNYIRPRGCEIRDDFLNPRAIQQGEPWCQNPTTPSAKAVTSARLEFSKALAGAHVLIGVDNSGPMAPDLARITSAVDHVLGSPGAPIGPLDRLAVWAVPGDGAGGQPYSQLVGFEPAASANRQRIARAIGVLTAHAHSAVYDMLAAGDNLLRHNAPLAGEAGPPPDNAVILLTDGDGDPPGEQNTAASVATLFSQPPVSTYDVALYIIAFGPPGCTPAMRRLADTTRGTCYSADGGDPQQLLGRVLGQITGGE